MNPFKEVLWLSSILFPLFSPFESVMCTFYERAPFRNSPLICTVQILPNLNYSLSQDQNGGIICSKHIVFKTSKYSYDQSKSDFQFNSKFYFFFPYKMLYFRLKRHNDLEPGTIIIKISMHIFS